MTRIIFDVESTNLIDNLIERIICICCYNVDAQEMKSFSGEDEGKILSDFFGYVSSCKSPYLIGYNSDSFDLPFLVRKAIIRKIKVPHFNTLDLRKVANGFKYSYNRNEKGKLRDWAVALDIPVKTNCGADMFKLYTEKKFDEIEEHCKEDVLITKELYERARACELI